MLVTTLMELLKKALWIDNPLTGVYEWDIEKSYIICALARLSDSVVSGNGIFRTLGSVDVAWHGVW